MLVSLEVWGLSQHTHHPKQVTYYLLQEAFAELSQDELLPLPWVLIVPMLTFLPLIYQSQLIPALKSKFKLSGILQVSS